MKPMMCAQCGSEIEGKPVTFRGRWFCSDDCCETFDQDFALKGEPGADDLDDELEADFEDDFDEDDFDEDLGYKDDEDDEDDGFDLDDDDDF